MLRDDGADSCIRSVQEKGGGGSSGTGAYEARPRLFQRRGAEAGRRAEAFTVEGCGRHLNPGRWGALHCPLLLPSPFLGAFCIKGHGQCEEINTRIQPSLKNENKNSIE